VRQFAALKEFVCDFNTKVRGCLINKEGVMKSQCTNFILACSLVISLFLLLGCDDDGGSTGSSVSSDVRIDAYVDIWDSENTTAVVTVWIAHCPGVPEVMINGTSMVYTPGLEPPIWDQYFPLSPGDPVQLIASFILENGKNGSAAANIMMPGPFEIVSPDSPADITLVNNTIIAWTSSSYAEKYELNVNLGYRYYDGEESIYSQSHLHYTLVDTVVNVPPREMFPNLDEIESLERIYCTVVVVASYGPEVYEPSNFAGDAEGWLRGELWEHEVITTDSLMIYN